MQAQEQEKEEIRTIYQRLKPAEETREFFRDTNKKFDNIEKMSNELNTKFQLMNQDIKEIKNDLKELKGTLKEFCESCDTRYASKAFESNVTKILWGAGFLIVGAVAAAIFKSILK